MSTRPLPTFQREFFGAEETFTRIGAGAIGGKAVGLDHVRREILSGLDAAEFPAISVMVPTLTVLTTEVFEAFLDRNGLHEVALSGAPDDRIAHRFQQADFPAEFVGDLRALIGQVRSPLAVRSSSLLEDALDHPFAGVYGTKMIPNNQTDVDLRFRRLVEAIKFVYASTFFAPARDYLRSIGQADGVERMAVILQEVIGRRHGPRYYPTLSGVARSYNYYPTQRATPEDGVVSLALGLGKQIVDGGTCWSYAPPYPRAPQPFNDLRDLMKNTQSRFWAVNMGQPPPPDPIRETEYLVYEPLSVAEADGTLQHLASTYVAADDRLQMGLAAPGPRVLNFAPLLDAGVLPLNALLRRLLALSTQALGTAVEIEFAMDLGPERSQAARFGFLQVRPMRIADAAVEVSREEMDGPEVLLAADHVLGHGIRCDITDVVYLKPDAFRAAATRQMAAELAVVNRQLLDADRPYLLIGFGRWGSSDPWLGVPVEWGQISGARVIVESTLPAMSPELSQGSHFFHNLVGFRVLYLALGHDGPHRIDWAWLDGLPSENETEFLRHVRCPAPLEVKVDANQRRGVVLRHG